MSCDIGKVLGIIPARGGSKGVRRKNIRDMAGKPLIVWTIEAAQRAQHLDRVVVSTEDEEIAQVSAAAGAQVIQRPMELAQDTTPTEPVLFHAVEYLQEHEGYKPDAVCLLQCTSPLRGSETIDKCIETLFTTRCDVVMTVAPVQHWYLMGRMDEEGRFQPEYDYHNRPFSQDMPEKYRENGACFVTRLEALYKYQNRLGGDVRIVPLDPVRSNDIDTEEDFRLAEEVLKGLRIT